MSVKDEIVKRNKDLQKLYYKTYKIAQSKLKRIKKQRIAPCEFCKYDGEYRCECCSENFYEGFNIKDYPN